MKGSDFGAKPPSMVGQWAYAMFEDGNGDGVWLNSTTSREEAILELQVECDSDGLHGYVVECVEAEVYGMDADRIIEQISEWAYEKFGKLAESWPDPTEEQLDKLEARLDKVLGEWLTECDLWPDFCGIGPVQKVTLNDLSTGEK